MANSSSHPFHRQLTSSFMVAFLLFFLVLLTASAAFYLQQQQSDFFQNQQLPQLAQAQKNQQSLRLATEQIATIFTQKNAEQLPSLHKNLDKELRKLRFSPYKPAILPNASYYETGNVFVNLNRIARNSGKNVELQQQAEQQLALLIDNFRNEIADKEVKQNQLYRQIANDTANDRVTANRARAYAILTQKLVSFHKLNNLLVNLNDGFQGLTIQTPIISFELLSDKVEQTFALYQQLEKSSLISNDQLKAQFVRLEQILITEQLTLSKWRGHLRIAEPYLDALAIQQSQLLQTLAQPLNNEVAETIGLPNNIVQAWLAENDIALSHQQMLQLLLLTLLILSLALVMALMRIRKRIKEHGKNSIMLCQQLSANPDAQMKNFLSLEHSHIDKLIRSISKPEHSENDYQALVTKQQFESEYLQKNCQVAYWSSEQNQQQKQQLISLLFSNKERKKFAINQYWRTWFDAHNYKSLVTAASLAKSSDKPQNLQVNSVTGKTLLVHVCYQQGHFYGSLQDINKQTLLAQQLLQLTELNEQQEQHNIAARLEQYQRAHKTAINTLLQNQSVLLAANLPSLKVHRRLVKMLASNEQDLAFIKLQDANHSYQLQDFNFRDKLHSAVFNAMFAANKQKNRVLLQCDEKLTDDAKLDPKLFLQLITSVSDSLLTEQFNATLLLDCQLGDKNSGQQIVRFCATVFSEKTIKQLPEILALFVGQNQDALTDFSTGFNGYIQALFSALHITNVQASYNEQSYQLTFDLPIATAVALPKTIHNNSELANLKQAKVLILVDDEQNQVLMKNAIKAANGQVDCFTDFKQLSVQLSHEQLSKKPQDVLIIATESALAKLNDIKQLLAKLPQKQQPKLMVIQTFFNAPLARQGLYSQASTPFCQSTFVADLHALLQGDGTDNCLLTSEAFTQYRPSASPTEVLFAVKSPQQHQVHIRLLQWLGLQVTVVNDEQSASEQWQQGRYLLLVTEFNQSPFVALHAGQGIARGVFYFSDQQFAVITPEEALIAEKWLVEQLPPLEQVTELINLLKPWLTIADGSKKVLADKAVTITVNGESQPAVHAQVAKSSPSQGTIDEVVDEFEHDIDDSDYDFDTELLAGLSFNELEPLDANGAFDLTAYAANQGSPELAAFMLTTYVDELHQYADELTQALQEQEFSAAKSLVEQILIVGQIMAASDLVNSAQQLSGQLAQGTSEIAPAMIDNLMMNIEAVDLYAEAI